MALAWPAVLDVALSGLVSTGGMEKWQDPTLFLAMQATIHFLFLVQFLACAFGLCAYYANRHIPGFLPGVDVPQPFPPR